MPSVDSLRTSLQAQIAPGNDTEFLRLLSEADMRLLEFGRWKWTRGRVTLTPSSGVVTLPLNFASLLAARVDTYPIGIEEEEYEFNPNGPGEIEVGGGRSVRLIDQGLDGSDQRTYKVVGESTDDDYTVYALAMYAPFTLYYTEDLPASPTVVESDQTRVPSVGPLKLMMLGIIFEEDHDLGASAHYVATALKALDNHGQNKRGGAKQRVSLNPYGPGVSKIRNYR